MVSSSRRSATAARSSRSSRSCWNVPIGITTAVFSPSALITYWYSISSSFNMASLYRGRLTKGRQVIEDSRRVALKKHGSKGVGRFDLTTRTLASLLAAARRGAARKPGDLRDDLLLVELHKAFLIGADLMHVDVI